MRILHMVPDISVSNGVMSVIFNYAKAMPNDIKFDVVYFVEKENNRRNEIENLGGKVYKVDYPSVRNFLSFKMYDFLKSHKGEWDVLHIHCPHFALFIAPFAQMSGIKKIAVHCHTTEYSLKGNSKRNRLLSLYAKYFIGDKFACSNDSGKFWFGNKKFTVINNGIDSEKYAYNQSVSSRVRQELNLNNDLVVAHIGRTDIPQKNHKFIIQVFSQLKKIKNDAKLVLIGAEKNNELENACIKGNVENDVLFLGIRQDVAELLQGADVFLFPSLSEGLPVSVVEAQAAGLPVLKSTAVTDEVKLFDTTVSMSLASDCKMWAEKIIELSKLPRQNNVLQIKDKGWDINEVSQELEMYYR